MTYAELTKDQEGCSTSLLILPRSDLCVQHTIVGDVPLTTGRRQLARDRLSSLAVGNDKAANSTSSSPSALRLLQLPVGWKVEDLVKNGAHFVAKAETEGQQAHLVVEGSKQQSFSVFKVETSNVLVMLPTLLFMSETRDNEQDLTLQSPAEPAFKRPKVGHQALKDGATILVARSARLLKPGGSGASFLELRPKQLRLVDLRRELQQCHFDPCAIEPRTEDNSLPGRTVESLARSLQVSTGQVGKMLQRTPEAFGRDTCPVTYSWLSEQSLLESYSAIISGLSEWQGADDYGGRGVHFRQLVSFIMDRMSAEESFPYADAVISHCLGTLRKEDGFDREHICLDVTKVAKCVARCIFQRQCEPWDESLFLARWQSEMPGVGDPYQVDAKMLRGLAVDIIASDGSNRFWKYFPAEKLPEDPSQFFAALFECRSAWLLDELQPYLDRLVDLSAISQTELLVKYTALKTEEQDGVTIKWYHGLLV